MHLAMCEKSIGLGVVFFDQSFGAWHSKGWSESAFCVFARF